MKSMDQQTGIDDRGHRCGLLIKSITKHFCKPSRRGGLPIFRTRELVTFRRNSYLSAEKPAIRTKKVGKFTLNSHHLSLSFWLRVQCAENYFQAQKSD